MLKMTVTTWSGFPEPPTIVMVADEEGPDEPQGPPPSRPVLRLIRGGEDS